LCNTNNIAQKDDETRYQFFDVCLKLWKLSGQSNDNKASKTKTDVLDELDNILVSG
jgi:hypothetical protein